MLGISTSACNISTLLFPFIDSTQKPGLGLPTTSNFLKTAPDLNEEPISLDRTSLITNRTGPLPMNLGSDSSLCRERKDAE